MAVAKNLGGGGVALDAQYGSSPGSNTNEPLLLGHSGANYLYLPGVTGNFASVPDSAALDITGDLELVLRISLDDWTPASEEYPFAKRGGANQKSWLWAATTGGLMRLYYSTDGSTEATATSTAAVPFTNGQAGWLKITLDVDNGAGGRDVKFFTAADQATEPTTFTQLGATITTAGTISLFNSTSVVSVGAYADGGWTSGKFYRAIVRNGIGGTTVLDVDFTTGITSGGQVRIHSDGPGAPVIPIAADTAINLGTGGAVLDARYGSAVGSDTNDPLLLEHSGTNYLYLPGVSGNYASVPDSAALDLTTEADIQVRIAFDDWTPAVLGRIIWKGNTAGTDHAYGFTLNAAGTLNWRIGATAGVNATSSVATGLTDGSAAWIRVTWRASDGRTQFFTAADSATVPSSWTQLGTDQTASLASLNDSTSALHIGEQGAGGGNTVAGKVYRVRVLSTIGGTTVLDANFTTGITSGGQTSFTESSSNAATVTINRSTSGRKAVAVVRNVWLLGTDDYFEVADNDLLDFGATDSFTVVAVVRQWATPTNFGRYVSKRPIPNGDTGYEMLSEGTTLSLHAAIDSGTPAASRVGLTTFTAGTLSSLGFVVDRSTQTMASFTGGTLSATADTSGVGSLVSSEGLRIGSRSASTAYQDFELLAALVFRRALSASELQDIETHYTSAPTATSNALMAGSVFWIDAGRQRTLTINRSTSGRKSVAVVRNVWLLGTDDYFEVADNDLLDFGPTESFTVVAIYRNWSTIITQHTYVSKKQDTSASTVGWMLYGNPGLPNASSMIGDGTDRPYVDGVTAGAAGTAVMSVAIRNTQTDQLIAYTRVGSAAAPTTDSTTTSIANNLAMRIGRRAGSGTGYADMELLAAMVFRRALSAAELSAIAAYYGV
jgi:hypothetical protein